jgi:putative FmdB family regulatory protein
MPLFDFHCPACQNDFELLVRGDNVPSCPECGANSLQKRVSAPQAPGKTASIIAGARRQAARGGHFSNYSRSERAKVK